MNCCGIGFFWSTIRYIIYNVFSLSLSPSCPKEFLCYRQKLYERHTCSVWLFRTPALLQSWFQRENNLQNENNKNSVLFLFGRCVKGESIVKAIHAVTIVLCGTYLVDGRWPFASSTKAKCQGLQLKLKLKSKTIYITFICINRLTNVNWMLYVCLCKMRVEGERCPTSSIYKAMGCRP